MDAHRLIQTIFHILAIVVILGFIALQGVGCGLLMGAIADSASGDMPVQSGRDKTLFGDEGASAHFLRVPVVGVITAHAEDAILSTATSLPERVDKLLAHAADSDEIVGILVDIDSPGGAVDPSDVIFQRLRRFGSDTGKPVIARLNGVAASGGYYIAVAADRIMAHPNCLTGSIGVIIQSLNMAGAFDKMGLELVTLASGPNKDLLNPGREMKKEERDILMGVIDDAYGSFVAAVAAGRNLEEDEVRELADGRIYTARQALDLGLIDKIGYRDELLAMLREVSGEATVDVVEHKLPSHWLEILDLAMEGLADRIAPTGRIQALDRLNRAPGLYYLWEPGL